ncbi:type II toxin-antitoxin system PemK/MazF family toxin [Mobilicoccus caccae]|uniref:type II toxin-antitoxin system PemK/MazF family toxin n=1 Tax=Mobilicoccus caccae TaxID=1859295 RepID=UPI0024E0B0D7|nr:type II toxin-antitoxin system PemK/MazF family toxin [Mobilicoccus caccae]
MSIPARGEVWWCEVPGAGRRPVVVLSRDQAIVARRLAVVAPCTTRRRGLPSEVELEPGTDPVPRPCVASLDSLESVPVAWCVERVGRLSSARLQEVCSALGVALDCL